MPTSSISPWEYAFGYSLWWILALVIASSVWLKKRHEAQLRADAMSPLTFGPPLLHLEGDKFITEQVKGQLRPGEKIQHLAYSTIGKGLGANPQIRKPFGATFHAS